MSNTKQLLIIAGLILVSGYTAITYADNTINAIQVEKPQGLVETSQLSGFPSPDNNERTLSTYDVQGGYRQTLQVTATNGITPQPAAQGLGDSESTDTLQPALGYGALNGTLQ